MKFGLRLLWTIGAHTLFWGWNLWFLSILWLGMGPALFAELLVASWVGMVPWHITTFVGLLMALPAAGMALGLWKLRTDPGRLLSLFYGVQAPWMMLCLVRIFAVGQLTPATTLALVVSAIGALGLLRTLLSGFEERSTLAQAARLSAQSVWLVVGLWWAALVALYAVGLAGATFDALVELALHPREWLGLAYASPFVLFAYGTVAVILTFPVAMLGISARAWQLVHRHSAPRLGLGGAWAITVGTALAVVGAFAWASWQPQGEAFAILEAATTDEARRAALARSEAVREGLLNARLASERTFDSDPEGEHIEQMYDDLVGDTLATLPQAAWAGLMAPFRYHPHHEGFVWGGGRGWSAVPADVGEAEAAYAAFFDAPMGRAERDVLIEAARQTWSWEAAQASLVDIGQRRVHLHRQAIDVEAHGDVAIVTIHDVYRGRTWEREEVLLAFSLPETAAISGVWLGHDDDRSAAFRHVVAPRGAAQEVYEREVQRRVDPALLEQVGPRQYRLRAFPIEPREGRASDVSSITREGPELHLWLEVVVPRTEAGWPLPRLAEARNLFWDEDTARTLNGVPVEADRWTPEVLPATGGRLGALEAVVSGWRVTAEPAGPPRRADLGAIRVLVDGTRSMDARRDALGEALATLRAEARDVELYCTREAAVVRCDDFDAATALFWGARPLEEQVAALPGGGRDVVVLTDAGSYELSSDAPAPLEWRGGRLWLVHLGGALPSAYPDATLDALQRSGGGAVASVDELLVRVADPDVRDGWRWTVAPTDAPDTAGPATKLAARQVVASLDRGARGTLDHLDAVHAVAVRHEVVTAYSSMIVLVNDRQREALAEAEQRDDRFDREGIDGAPEMAPVSSAPEPGTWLLLAAGGGLVLAGRRRRPSR